MAGSTDEHDEGGGFYLSRLARVTGWKGSFLLLVLLAATAARSLDPGSGVWWMGAVVAAGLLALGLVAKGSLPVMGGDTDLVGIALVGILAGFAGVRATAISEPWWSYGVFAGVLLVAVVVDYLASAEGALFGGWTKRDLARPELMKVDLAGLVVAEVLLIYAILVGGGWSGFATSPFFSGIAFYFAASFFAIAAGYTQIARESARDDRDYELHEFLLEMLIDLQGVDDATLQHDLAKNLRTVARRIDGAAIPSIVNDDQGPVPVVLPTRDPVKLYQGSSLEGLIEALETEGLTGYAVTDRGDAVLARNGELVKFYVDGTWGQDTEQVDVTPPRRALLYSTSQGLMNLIDGITPPDYGRGDRVPGSPDDEDVTFDALVDQVTSGHEETEKPFNVGGRDVDLQEMFERADDFLRKLTD